MLELIRRKTYSLFLLLFSIGVSPLIILFSEIQRRMMVEAIPDTCVIEQQEELKREICRKSSVIGRMQAMYI